ncbi:uncharacterized protein LOC108602046 isoform X2 [Drosophila busckii]|nr:uncharacterized protein LOC108602046 isoform X2 [Drosophila busckii]
MPWMLATISAPHVMQFGSNTNCNVETETQCGKWQQKRKSLDQLTSVLPSKQLITEERITAHFSGLQISGDANGVAAVRSAGNNNSIQTVNGGLATDDIPSTSTGKTHHPNPAYQMAAMELEQKLRNANRIVICDELKQNVNPATAPPVWLLKSIPRPCTALVPWQPNPLQVQISKEHCPQQDHSKQAAGEDVGQLDDYDDELHFFANNNTCNVNINKSAEQMDEDL